MKRIRLLAPAALLAAAAACSDTSPGLPTDPIPSQEPSPALPTDPIPAPSPILIGPPLP